MPPKGSKKNKDSAQITVADASLTRSKTQAQQLEESRAKLKDSVQQTIADQQFEQFMKTKINASELAEGTVYPIKWYKGVYQGEVCMCFQPRNVKEILINKDRLELTQQMQKLKQQIDELDNLLQTQKAAKDNDINEHKKEIAGLQAKIVAFEISLQEQQQSNVQNEGLIQQLENQIAAFKQEKQDLENTVADLTTTNNTFQQNLATRFQEVTRLTAEIEDLQKQKNQWTLVQQQLREQLEQLIQSHQSQVEELQTAKDKQRKDELETQAKDSQLVIEGLQKQYSQIQQVNQQIQAELLQATTQLSENKSMLTQKQKELTEVTTYSETQIEKLTNLRNQLQTEYDTLEAESKKIITEKEAELTQRQVTIDELQQKFKAQADQLTTQGADYEKLANQVKGWVGEYETEEKFAKKVELWTRIEKCTRDTKKTIFECVVNQPEYEQYRLMAPVYGTPIDPATIQLMLESVRLPPQTQDDFSLDSSTLSTLKTGNIKAKSREQQEETIEEEQAVVRKRRTRASFDVSVPQRKCVPPYYEWDESVRKCYPLTFSKVIDTDNTISTISDRSSSSAKISAKRPTLAPAPENVEMKWNIPTTQPSTQFYNSRAETRSIKQLQQQMRRLLME